MGRERPIILLELTRSANLTPFGARDQADASRSRTRRHARDGRPAPPSQRDRVALVFSIVEAPNLRRERTKVALPAAHFSSDGCETNKLPPRAVRNRWSGLCRGFILATNDGGATGGKSGDGVIRRPRALPAPRARLGQPVGWAASPDFPVQARADPRASREPEEAVDRPVAAQPEWRGAQAWPGRADILERAARLVERPGAVPPPWLRITISPAQRSAESHGAGEATAVGAGAVALSGLVKTTVKPRIVRCR